MGKKKSGGGKKDKKEKGGKGGGKKAKKGGGDPDAPVPDAIPIEQTSALLVFLTIEARKKSIAFYRAWCTQQRDLLKQQRAKLDKIGKNEYFSVKKMDQGDKDMESIMDTLVKQQQDGINASLDAEIDDDHSTLGIQRRQMAGIQNHIDQLEDDLEKTILRIQDLQEFTASGGTQQMETLAISLKQQLRTKMVDNLKELEKIQRRHDASMIATVKRKDRILAQLEAKANQQELENMSVERMMIFQRNKSLKEKVAVLVKEEARLKVHVQELEELNMRLVSKSLDLDWNLMYGKEKLDDDDDGVASDAVKAEKPSIGQVPKYHHLRLTNVDQAVAQVLLRQQEWQKQDLSSFGVIGTLWEPRKPNPKPATAVQTKTLLNRAKYGALVPITRDSQTNIGVYDSMVSVASGTRV